MFRELTPKASEKFPLQDEHRKYSFETSCLLQGKRKRKAPSWKLLVSDEIYIKGGDTCFETMTLPTCPSRLR
jgi:hypothetical protein